MADGAAEQPGLPKAEPVVLERGAELWVCAETLLHHATTLSYLTLWNWMDTHFEIATRIFP